MTNATHTLQNASQSELTKPAHAPISMPILSGLVQVSDAVLLAATGLVTAQAYVAFNAGQSSAYMLATLATTALAVALFQAFNLYKPSRIGAVAANLPALAIGWTTALATLVTVVFLLKAGDTFSRGWLLMWFAAGSASLFASRAGLSVAVARWQRQGRMTRRVVIVGANQQAADLIGALKSDRGADVEICGIFDDRNRQRDELPGLGAPILGGLDDLVAFARANHIDDVLITIPATAETRLLGMLKSLSVLPLDIRLAANVSRLRFQPRAYSYIGNVPFIDVFDRPIGDWGSVSKWIFDKAVAATALILLAPVMAAVAIAIRLDSRGPILFRQKRYGFNNELIEIYKFRSMYVDMADVNAAKLVTKDDPRVTPIGRIIRKTSLDELPQLLNVLFGDLSLVGPRPHAVQAKAANRLYNEVVDGYFARHKVKPGITGWAQINGWRGETDTEEKIEKRVEHDLYYIENWSLFLDFYILFRTPLALFDTKQAY